MAPKMDQKPLKITSEIDLDFNRLFQRFVDRFFASFVSANLKKHVKTESFYRFFTFSIFSSTCFVHPFWIVFLSVFRRLFGQKSKKNRYEKLSKKQPNFKHLFSPILVDLGLHFGPPAFRDRTSWASWAALWNCKALSWAILRDLLQVLVVLAPFLVHFGPLGSILGAIFDQIWFQFCRLGSFF